MCNVRSLMRMQTSGLTGSVGDISSPRWKGLWDIAGAEDVHTRCVRMQNVWWILEMYVCIYLRILRVVRPLAQNKGCENVQDFARKHIPVRLGKAIRTHYSLCGSQCSKELWHQASIDACCSYQHSYWCTQSCTHTHVYARRHAWAH